MNTRTIFFAAALLSLLILAAGCGRKQKNNEPAADPAAAQVDEPDMSQYMPNLRMGTEAPDFEAPDILGKPVKLNDFRGSYVVLDFWATWCKDCRAEMPAMKDLYNTYGPKGVQFLGVSFDTDIQTLIDYGVENEIAWMNVCNQVKWKENPISAAYDLHWIPTMFLISPEGMLAGVCFHASDMRTMLEDALDD